MLLRKATKNDMPVLLAFEQGIIIAERPMDPTLKPDPISYYDLLSYVEREDVEVVVAEIDGTVVGSGYTLIRKNNDYFKDAFYGYIGFMYVEPAHRGKGIAKDILVYLNNWLAARDISEIRLNVYDQNPSAIKAYEKAGFKKYIVEMRYNLDEND
jgi:ribosomal protein S18 acetylase RimI-like enzyme